MDSFAILDIRGLVLRSLHSGTDRDAVVDSLTGGRINTPGYAVEGFLRDYLIPILKDFRAKQVIAVWDGGNLYRRTLFPAYKQHRRDKEQSPELKQAMEGAIKAVKGLLLYLGAIQTTVDDVEADDVIAWLVEKLPSTIVYTVDRDLIQLAGDRCSVYVGREFTDVLQEGEVTVPAHRVTLFKSIVGDSSDGYLGVRGFGPKKWLKLVEEEGEHGLEVLQSWVSAGMFSELHRLVKENPGANELVELLAANTQDWRKGWMLASLQPDLVNRRVRKPVLDKETLEVISAGANGYQTPRWSTALPRADKLSPLLDSLGCTHLAHELAEFMPNMPAVLDASIVVDQEAALDELQAAFAESPFIALDWETSAPINPNFEKAANGREYVDMLSSTITGAGLTFGKRLEHTLYLSVDHADTQNLPAKFVHDLIRRIPAGIPLAIQNVYFEMVIYKNQFGEDLPECHDTKIMASHVDEQESNGLKDLSLRILGYKQLKYRDVIGKGKAMKDYSAEHVLQYGADDPLVTAHLYEFLKLQLLLEGTWEFVRDNEFTAVRHLVDAYIDGVEIDWDELERLRLEDEEIFDRSMTRLRQLLKEHQTPASIEAGVENLLEVERELLDARYEKKVEERTMTEVEAQIAKAKELALAYLNLRDRVEYLDPVRLEKPVKFGLTPAAFSTVTEKLDLPRLEANTKAGWTRWLAEAKQCQVAGLAARIVELVEEGFSDVVAKNENSPIVINILSKTRPIYLETLPYRRKYEMKGSELSLNSPKQMQALLYGTLGLPIRVRNFEPKGEREDLELEGGPQANEDAILTAMAMDAPAGTWKREALDCLLAAKKASTRCKNFYAAYPLWRHPLTGRVHPQLNSCGTETRRMSGSSPNLMQLPKKNEGIKVRKIIRPPQGHDLVCSIDWAGEELRVAAGLSLDTEMLSCYIDAEGVRKLPQWALKMLGTGNTNRFMSSTLRDIHSLTAAGIADVPYDEFEAVRHDKKHVNYSKFTRIRGEAKSVNFLSQYGGGPTKLARKLICPVEQAQDYLSSKKKLYYKYEDWREASIQKLHADGYLATLYGTRRHLFNRLITGDEGLRGYMERAALNFLIQGLCADYLKKVLTELWHRKTFQRHGAKFLAPIHDEIVFTCHSSQAPDLILEVHSIMTQGIEGLPCPLWAEPSVGPSFGVQKEIGPHPTKELIVAAINEALDTRAEVA